MSTHVERVVDVIQAEIAKVEGEIAQLKAALGALDEVGPPAAKPASKTPAPRRARKTKRRAKRGRRIEQFLELIQAEPGIGGSEIARRIGVTPNQVYGLAQRLAKDGRIVKSDGRYFSTAAVVE